MKRTGSFLRNLNEFGTQYEKQNNLSLIPTLIVLFVTSCVFGFIQVLMENYIMNSEEFIFLFIIGSYIVYSLYFVLDNHLKYMSSSYNSLPDKNEQFYVLSNLIKSGLLFIYTPLAFLLLWNIIVHNIWDHQRITHLGTLYVIPDFVSLFVVNKMQRNTVIHHLCVCIFYLFHINNNYNHENVCRLLVVYSIFSTFSYLVNFLLASRFLKLSTNNNFDKIIKKILIYFSLRIYVLCCSINWIWHIFYIFKMLNNKYVELNTYFSYFHISIYIYVSVISLVVYDDIVLIKYLHYKYKESII